MTNSYLNNLTRNIFSQTLGQILSLLINLFAIALAARYLGVSDFGIFNYLLAMIVILTKLVDLGIAPNIFREYSIKRALELIHTGVLLRVFLFLIIAILINIFFFLSSTDKREIILSNILLVNLLISSKGFIRELFEIPFKVDLKIHLPIVVMLMDNLLFLLLVFFMPSLNGGLIYFGIVYTFSNLPGFFVMIFLINRNYNYQIKTKIISTGWLVKNSFPLFIYTLSNTIFYNIDLLLLKKLDSAYSAGIYSASARIIIPMLIIPTAFIHSVFPKISTDYHNSAASNFVIIKFLFKTLFIFSFALAIVITFKSTELITFIYGSSFSASASSLSVLLWSQVFLFNSFLVINLLVAYNKQSSLYLFSISVLSLNIILNFVLIPQYSFVGAAYAKLFSNFLGFLITSTVLYRVDKTIYIFEKELILFSLISAVACYLLSFLSLPLYLITTGIFLVLFIVFIKFYNSTEIKFLLKLINKENWYGTGIFFNYLK